MKNMIKVWGIIAILAIIGLGVACSEADPEKQTTVTVIGLPEGVDGYDLNVLFTKDDSLSDGWEASAASPKPVVNGKSTVQMSNDKGAWDADGKQYYAWIELIDGGVKKHTGRSDSKMTIYTGANQWDLSDTSTFFFTFNPKLPSAAPPAPPATNYGTYTTTYTNQSNKSITETVTLTAGVNGNNDIFYISDNETNPVDFLNFRIDSWTEVSVPTDQPTYTGAWKFTGKILSQKSYTPSGQTAPGFSTADVKADGTGPECWMYIYFKGTAPNITFIRTPFSKSGNLNEGIVSGTGGPRVYTK